MNPGPCPTCGHEKRLLFTNYACFNERCGQESPASDLFAAWKRLLGEYAPILPGDIEVVRCEPYASQDAYDVVYQLKGVEWYGAQTVFLGELKYAAAVAKDVWDAVRKNRPINFAKVTKAASSSWSVP